MQSKLNAFYQNEFYRLRTHNVRFLHSQMNQLYNKYADKIQLSPLNALLSSNSFIDYFVTIRTKENKLLDNINCKQVIEKINGNHFGKCFTCFNINKKYQNQSELVIGKDDWSIFRISTIYDELIGFEDNIEFITFIILIAIIIRSLFYRLDQ